MNKRIISLSLMAFIAAIVFLTVLAYLYFAARINKVAAPASNDTSVYLLGDREFDYPATTLLAMENREGVLSFCGGVMIESNLLMTAAHCVENYARVGGYPGDFDASREGLYTASEVFINPEYKQLSDDFSIREVPHDLAFVRFSEAISGNVATLAAPELGCDYEAVGYGTTYEENLEGGQIILSQRPRQSIEVCITEISGGLIEMEPESGKGFCKGDSGSPVYRKDTNEVVGFLSAMVGVGANLGVCNLNNGALAADIASADEFVSRFASFESNTVRDSDEIDDDVLQRFEDSLREYGNETPDYYSSYDDFDRFNSENSNSNNSSFSTSSRSTSSSSSASSGSSLGFFDLIEGENVELSDEEVVGAFGLVFVCLLVCCVVLPIGGGFFGYKIMKDRKGKNNVRENKQVTPQSAAPIPVS